MGTPTYRLTYVVVIMALVTAAMLACYLPARRVSDENAISSFEITFARGASISVEVPSPSPHSPSL